MNKLRKFFVVSVMVLSVIAMSGLTVNPVSAAASAGDLIKMDGLSSVYYLGDDGKRYVFPNESTYFSWYADFSSVVTIPASELQSYPLGGNVVMRPGTTLVKITTDPSVYAVEPNGVLRKIQSESQATALYGTNWNKRIVDLADSFFTNYTIGTPLADGEIPAGSLVKNADSATVYYYDGTNYRAIASEAAMAANRLWMKYVMTVSNTLVAGGSPLTGMEAGLVKVNQGATTGPVVTGSGLMVSLNASTPASMNIPGGVSVDFLKINLTAANDGPVNVSSIKLTAYGLSAATNIREVTFYDGATKVGSSRNMNSDRVATFNFATPIYVAAGTTKTLTVKASILGSSGSYGIGIASASDVLASSASITGSFPVQGNLMSAVESNVGSLEVQSPVSSVDTPASFGEESVLLADFALKANNTEDVLISSLSFYNGGTNANNIVSNLKLFIDGQEAANGSYVNRYATFNLNNYEVKKGDSIAVELRSDIGITSINDTINFYLKDATDVVAYGKTHGFRVSVDQSNFNEGSEGIHVKLTSGDFTIAMDKTATPAKDVKPGDKRVVFATFSMKSNGENATVTGINGTHFYIQTSSNPDNFLLENVELVDLSTGGVYDLSVSTTTNRHKLALSGDDIALVGGVEKKFTVRADVLDGVAEDTTFRVILNKSALTVEGDVSNANITNITPTEVSGSIITVKKASLTLTPTVLTSTNVVGGSSNIEVYKAKVKAGTADSVRLQSIKLTSATSTATDSAFTNSNITKLDLYLNGNLLRSLSNQISGGAVSFTALNTAYNTIAAGAEVDLVVKATFASTVTEGDFHLKVHQAADVSSRSVDGNNTITATTAATFSRVITAVSAGNLKIELLTTDVKASQNQYVLAGAPVMDKYLGELKFTTKNEPVRVKKMTLTQLGTASNTDIALVSLVKADGTIVASKSAEANGNVIFDPLNLVFEADKATSLFIAVTAKGINVAGDPTATAELGKTIQFNLSAAAITAEGVDSGEAIVMTGANTPDWGKWDNNDVTKVFAVTPVKLNSVVSNSIPGNANNKLASGNQEVARYTLTFETGNNRDASNEAYKAQLDHFVLTLNQSNATATNFTLKVDGTTREVTASTTTSSLVTWDSTVLQNPATGLLNLAKLNNNVTLVVFADVEIEASANNFGIQTRIADLNGENDNDHIRHNGLTNMYLPYTSVNGVNLTN